MARYTCVRCGEESNTLDAPHLCKDVKQRANRRLKQRDAVVRILAARHAWLQDDGLDGGFYENVVTIAEEIVTKLAQMGVHVPDED